MESVALAYDLTSLLVEVGSCLGLWLGISVVGVFDLLVHMLDRTRDKIILLTRRRDEHRNVCGQNAPGNKDENKMP